MGWTARGGTAVRVACLTGSWVCVAGMAQAARVSPAAWPPEGVGWFGKILGVLLPFIVNFAINEVAIWFSARL